MKTRLAILNVRYGITLIWTILLVPIIMARAAYAGEGASMNQAYRYDEEFRYLRIKDHPEDIWDPIKDVQFGATTNSYASFGSELRERFESYSEPGFGLRGHDRDSYRLQRLMVHGDVHFSEYIRSFLQVGYENSFGRNPVTPTDKDHGDINQGFVDVTFPIGDYVSPTFRVGRQEIGLGSQRLVSVREGANIRRSFDGMRMLSSIGDITLNLVAIRPVVLDQDSFNDRFDHKQNLTGIYSTIAKVGTLNLSADIYYLDFHNQAAKFGSSVGDEKRHSLGARLFGSFKQWDWNFEGVVQTGSFANQNIRAWMLASDTGMTLTQLQWRPRIGLKANIASGDHNSRGHTLGIFNPLFPKLPYFSEATLVSPSNFYDFYPSITIRPTSQVSLTIGRDYLWRESIHDAAYGSPFTPYPGTLNTAGRKIGEQTVVEGQWQFDPHITITWSIADFKAEPLLYCGTINGGKQLDI